ncbi:hypothetical protein MPH_05067 [Macrophomina phaseolina MS6]|uniref:Uncharacterized protein n=1 Tax=Macrophomina phaseolina (strain MS6) TaxID=1126212 RepID=K2S521_MACPH|nr:hypothetical protein MPH_05067 [Macrophomina phaseolina MS6]
MAPVFRNQAKGTRLGEEGNDRRLSRSLRTSFRSAPSNLAPNNAERRQLRGAARPMVSHAGLGSMLRKRSSFVRGSLSLSPVRSGPPITRETLTRCRARPLPRRSPLWAPARRRSVSQPPRACVECGVWRAAAVREGVGSEGSVTLPNCSDVSAALTCQCQREQLFAPSEELGAPRARGH